MATYVMSDIHGQYKMFINMLKLIEFNKNDELYILGDVVDRGPEPLKLLLKTMRTPNIHLLMGNHEFMMLNAYKYKDFERHSVWMRNGGNITREKLHNYSENTLKKIWSYLSALPVEQRVTVDEKEFILCHAQPHPLSFKDDPLKNPCIGYMYESDEDFAVWHREKTNSQKSKSKYPYGIIQDENFADKTVIFGHTPTYCYNKDVPEKCCVINENNTYNIDCGCASVAYEGNPYNGRLACMKLDDMSVYYIEP